MERIDIDAVVLLDVFCKTDLVLVLNIHEFLLALLIIHINRNFFNIGEICDLISDLVVSPSLQGAVSVKQETSLGDTVCLIIKFLRHHLTSEVFLTPAFPGSLCEALQHRLQRSCRRLQGKPCGPVRRK